MTLEFLLCDACSPNVCDFQVEDPAEGFQQMRAVCDLGYLTAGKFFQDTDPLTVLLDKKQFDALQLKTKLSPV